MSIYIDVKEIKGKQVKQYELSWEIKNHIMKFIRPPPVRERLDMLFASTHHHHPILTQQVRWKIAAILDPDVKKLKQRPWGIQKLLMGHTKQGNKQNKDINGKWDFLWEQ